VRRFFLPLMAMTLALSSSSITKSRPSNAICAWLGSTSGPEITRSLPGALPRVVTGLWML
jgi:hypothetical protein